MIFHPRARCFSPCGQRDKIQGMYKQDSFNGGGVPNVFQFMPRGTSVIHASVNGKPGTREVVVDASAAERLQRDLEEKLAAADAGQKARPCGLFDHKDGKACLLPKRFYWDDDKGVMLEADWTQAGKAAVEGRDYSYWSPCFRLGRDGRVVGLTGGVEVGSLVNNPAFETIARIAAARAEVDEPADDVVDVNGSAQEVEPEDEPEDEMARMGLAELRAELGKRHATPVVERIKARIAELEKREDEGMEPEEKKEVSPLKRAHLAALEKWRKSKERKVAKDADLQDVRERVRLAAACGKCKPVIENVRERVKAANPYGCNQYGHGFKAEHEGYGAGGQKTLNLGDTVDKQRAKEVKELDRLKKDAVDKARKAREASKKWDSIDWRDDEGNRKAREEFNEASRKADKAKDDLLNKRGERQRKEYEAAPKRGDERNVKENMGKEDDRRRKESGESFSRLNRERLNRVMDSATDPFSMTGWNDDQLSEYNDRKRDFLNPRTKKEREENARRVRDMIRKTKANMRKVTANDANKRALEVLERDLEELVSGL